MSEGAEKIVRRKLSDEIFDRLVRMIESGELRPGDQLPSERELMSRYGVGRPAIREAMQTLETMGLITIHHGERARVVQPTAAALIAQLDFAAIHLINSQPQTLGHLKEAREFFEIGMVREAAAKATEEDIARLRAALDEQHRHLGGDPKAFVAADMAFHTAIAAISRNPVFEAVSRAMLNWLSRFHSGLLHWKGKERVTLAEHEQILKAIAAHDAEAAATLMREHLRRTASKFVARRKP